jgi:ArsR family transcriptional regulator
MPKYRSDELGRIAEMFGALANPKRLEIFTRLASLCEPGTECSGPECETACVSELGRGLGIAPSTLSHHLKELRRTGLLRMERNGRKIDCSVDPGCARVCAELLAVPGEPAQGEEGQPA